ncbi:MAG: N-acetylglucosaminyl-diphospho-decaprenol L-rhamnosyltransferase [Paracoccaceae bacterium]|jgi:N-acetylglucosaminyl-diphospho-decaprenol L-rhamnosyltransferase
MQPNEKAKASWGAGAPGSEAPQRPPVRDLAISIINYRTAEMTIACARTVLDAIAGLDAHVVITDNFSDDGSDAILQAFVEALGPDAPVTLALSPVNTGFSGGHNIGIRAAKARFYLLFNSDAELHAGAPQALLARAAADPKAGIIGCRLEYDDGQMQDSCFRFPGPKSELMRGAQTGFVTKAFLDRWVVMEMPPSGPVEWLSFASVMLRAEMIEAIGMMDEGFFLYSEDTEYCWRARQNGWDVVWEGGARAIHHRGGSSDAKEKAAEKKRVPPYVYASRSRLMAILHGGAAGLLLCNLAWLAGRAITHLRLLGGRRPVPAMQNEARDVWINALDPYGDPRKPKGA